MTTITTPFLSARFLSQDERIVIGDRAGAAAGAGAGAGASLRSIGCELRRPASTISREVRRNRDDESGRYRPFAAHR